MNELGAREQADQPDSTGLRLDVHLLQARSSSNDHPVLDAMRALTDAARVLIWPCLVLALVLIYRGPLNKTVNALVDKLLLADKFSVWTLSFEIRQQARSLGGEQLATQLEGLTAETIAALIQVPRPGSQVLVGDFAVDNEPAYHLPPAQRVEQLRALAQRGLISSTEDFSEFLTFWQTLPWKPPKASGEREWRIYHPAQPLTEAQATRIHEQRYALTELGEKGVSAIIQAVVSQIESGKQRDRALSSGCDTRSESP